MTPISAGAERRRRIVTRALPLLAIAAVAFVAGLVVGGGSDELDPVKRFITAWEAGDFEAMHAELAPAAAAEYPLEAFAAEYDAAAATATQNGIDAGEPAGPRSDGGGEVADVDATARTKAFGDVGGALAIPIVEGGIDWRPELAFPGLEPGEKLDRRTRAPKRAAILAARQRRARRLG